MCLFFSVLIPTDTTHNVPLVGIPFKFNSSLLNPCNYTISTTCMAGKGIKHPHLRHWGQEWVCRGFLHGTWTGHLPPSCFSTVAMPLLINTALVCGCSDGWSNLSNGSIPAAKSNPDKQVLVSYLTPLTSADLSDIQTFTMWLFLIKLYKWNVSNCYQIHDSELASEKLHDQADCESQYEQCCKC